MCKPMTIQDLTKECLKQMDAGNGNKLVMVSNDTKWGYYHPIMELFEDNKDEILKVVNTKNPNSVVLLG